MLTRCSSTTHIRNHLLKYHSDIPEVVRDIPIAKSHAENRQQQNSLVWKYCVMTAQNQASCLLCNKTVLSFNGSTTEIQDHLMIYHSENQDIVKDFLPCVPWNISLESLNQNQQKSVFAGQINKNISK